MAAGRMGQVGVARYSSLALSSGLTSHCFKGQAYATSFWSKIASDVLESSARYQFLKELEGLSNAYLRMMRDVRSGLPSAYLASKNS